MLFVQECLLGNHEVYAIHTRNVCPEINEVYATHTIQNYLFGNGKKQGTCKSLIEGPKKPWDPEGRYQIMLLLPPQSWLGAGPGFTGLMILSLGVVATLLVSLGTVAMS